MPIHLSISLNKIRLVTDSTSTSSNWAYLNCKELKFSIAAADSSFLATTWVFISDGFTAVAGAVLNSIPSINFVDFFAAILALTCSILTDDCALADKVVPEKMPMATETRKKFFIRKL